jgi:CheY-like chemotaxis protein/putative methionine-R-sulfoxide reductase with GAF domain
MAPQTQLRKLLVLDGPALQAQGVLDYLKECFDVQVAQELDAALAAMRDGHFDAVLAETADFLPLERGAVVQQAAVVLDTIGDGVCVVGPAGELVWANRRMRDCPAPVINSLRQLCAKAFEELSAGRRGGDHVRRFCLMSEGGSYYEVLCSPVRDRAGAVRQVAAVVVDATHQRRQQLKLNAIDRAGRELVRLDDEDLSRRDAIERLRLLEDRILRCSRDVLDYQHFAVYVLNERANTLELLVSQGLSPESQRHELLASPEGNGISGYVAATGRSYICPDVQRDGRYLKGMEAARSSLTVPLRLHDKVVGVLNVESDRVGAFGEEDRQFAEIFAHYVALTLHILNLLVVERHSVQTQVSGSIAAELNGPLNDIIAIAGELVEDYIGHDDLRARLGRVIQAASRARQSVQQLARAPSTGVLGGPAGAPTPDPLFVGKRLLVVDDEQLIRQTVRDVLAPLGCRVDVAADGLEGTRLVGACQYDLVISDVKMPGASGYDVFNAARDQDPQAQVILITAFGYDPDHSIVRASREGLAAVLMKPFTVKRLLEECRKALSAART